MPFAEATADTVELGRTRKAAESDINRMVHTILKTSFAMDAFGRKPDPAMIEKFREHEMTALQVAREGVVLLKNDKGLLPLRGESLEDIVLTGPFADRVAEGGGAAHVKGYNHVLLNEALKREFGDKLSYLPDATDERLRQASAVLLGIGTDDSEGWDRPFDLPGEMVTLAERVASLNPRAVVIVNSGSGINMSRRHEQVDAILYAWYPGQIGSVATAEIVGGKINPSGKPPISTEKDFADSPGAGYLPGGEELYSERNEEEENRRSIYDIEYKEGV